MRSLDSRLERIEVELGISEPEKPTDVDPEEEARAVEFREAMVTLTGTMSAEHWQVVSDDLEGRTKGRISGLTKNFLGRAARYVKGDKRPLALPPVVASLYLVRRPRNELVDRECLSCGYDVVDTLAELQCPACPICGGDYEPIEPGEGKRYSKLYRRWSKANPDKLVSVYVWENGAICW